MVQCYRPPGRDGVASVFALLVQPTPAMREDPPFLAHNSSAAGADIGLPKMLARYPTLIPVAWPTAMWRRVRLSLHPFSTKTGHSVHFSIADVQMQRTDHPKKVFMKPAAAQSSLPN